MLIFSLKWFVLFILLLVLAIVACTYWFLSHKRDVLPHLRTQQLEAILNEAPFGWLILGLSTRYEYANSYSQQLLGLAAQTGHLPDTVWATLLQEDRTQTLAQDKGQYRQLVLTSGQMVQWWVYPMKADSLVFLFDVSEQSRIQESSRQLLSNLSHELRTPLGTIATHLEILSLPNIPEPTAQESLKLLKQKGQRMSLLVSQMLNLGRIETETAQNWHYVDLLTIAQETVSQLLPAAETKQISLQMESQTSLPSVLGDSNHLKQVFLNLIDNAIKHNPDGTVIWISLQQQAEGLCCTITDNGLGIPAEHLPYLTNRFYRAASQKTEGSGLGLALVTEILRRHHSKLVIENQTEGENRGVRVSFTLALPQNEDAKEWRNL